MTIVSHAPAVTMFPVSLPSALQRRLIVLISVLGVHGLAVWLFLHVDAGLPVTAPAGVVQVSWVNAQAASSQPAASPSSAATTSGSQAPLPPRQQSKPPAVKPKPRVKAKSPTVPIAQKLTTEPGEPPSTTETAAAEPASSVSPAADSPSPSKSTAGSGASSTGGGASSAGEAGYSAPRFNAAYLSNPAPEYPSISREMGEEGRVFLRVQVSSEGRPLEIRVYKSSGHDRLDQAALEAVRRWQFVPGHVGTEPVTAQVIVPINFFLQ